MARYSVNNYTVENLLYGLGDPVNTVIALSPACGGGDCGFVGFVCRDTSGKEGREFLFPEELTCLQQVRWLQTTGCR